MVKNWVCWEEWGLLRRQSSCGSWRQSVRRQQIRSTLWDCEIPDRSTAIFGKGESPAPVLEARLRQLCDMGAEVLAVPCNTAHYFIDDFKAALPQPLVHIIEETVLAAQRLNPEGAWMLSTHGTRASGLYQKYADKHGYTLYLPNEEQAEKAQQAIFYVKAGELDRAGAVTRA